MGVDYTAYAVLGVKFSYEEFMKPFKRIEETRCCKHSEQKAKFCPECGKPMWKERDMSPDLYEIEEEFEKYGLEIVTDTDSYNVYVGMSTKKEAESYRDKGEAFKVVDDTDVLLRHLEARLFKKGLWSEEIASRFGLWAVMYCSY